MRISITGRHCDVPTRVAERTEKLVGKLDRYEARATAADVIYTEEKHTRSVEVIVHIDAAPHVTARGDGDDFRTALDRAMERLKRLLREGRERRRDHQAPPLSEQAPPE